MNNVTDVLASKGLKLTHQRIILYKELVSSKLHPSAEDMYEHVRKDNPSISLATVYKILETFVDKGLARRVSTPKGSMRYDGRMDDHNHIFISNTNEIVDFDDEELKGILNDYLNRKKFQNLNITDIRLQIRGEKLNKNEQIIVS